MIKPYVKPTTRSYRVEYESYMLMGSAEDNDNITRNYACPYVRSFWCAKYSQHMNAWRMAVMYESNGKTNPEDLFYAHAGCIYKNSCDVYKHYLFYQTHHQSKK